MDLDELKLNEASIALLIASIIVSVLLLDQPAINQIQFS